MASIIWKFQITRTSGGVTTTSPEQFGNVGAIEDAVGDLLLWADGDVEFTIKISPHVAMSDRTGYES